jgi:hypothetical protein
MIDILDNGKRYIIIRLTVIKRILKTNIGIHLLNVFTLELDQFLSS